MHTLDLLNAIGAAQDEFIQETFSAKPCCRAARIRFSMLAALIALLLLLAGCAAWFYRLENLILIDHADEIQIASTTPASNSELFVAENVLSMQGFEDSPAYNALQEWLVYSTDYIHQHPEVRFHSDFKRPDSYECYPCYSQEMVDKTEELCSKYGLHILGKSTFLKNLSEMQEAGLTYVLSPAAVTRCFLGTLFADGSFVAEGELDLSERCEMAVQFQLHRIRKDAFYTTPLGINGLSRCTQWNYRTKNGSHALLALNSTTGLIFTENDNSFITVIIEEVPDANMTWHGLPEEKAFLETVCDCFRF